MQRRDFLKIAGVAAAGGSLVGQQTQSFLAPTGPEDIAKTDFTLQIAPVTRRTRAQSHSQHRRVQRYFARAAAAHEGGRPGHGECDQ